MTGFHPVRLSDDQRLDWLRLIRTENVGPRTFRMLINQFGGAKRAIERLPDLARRGGRALNVVSREQAAREISAATKLGVRYVGLGEIEYPALLRETDDARRSRCAWHLEALASPRSPSSARNARRHRLARSSRANRATPGSSSFPARARHRFVRASRNACDRHGAARRRS